MTDARKNQLLMMVLGANLTSRFLPVAHAEPAARAPACRFFEASGIGSGEKRLGSLVSEAPGPLAGAEHAVVRPLTVGGTYTGSVLCTW